MPLQFIHIIRDLTDRAGRSSPKSRSFCCSDADVPLKANWEPNTDIVESEEQVTIRMELAGISRDQVTIHLKNGKLIVTGVRSEQKPDKKAYYHQLELHYGTFIKIIALPESIEHNDITATLSDGLLEIKISKKSTIIEIAIADEIKMTK